MNLIKSEQDWISFINDNLTNQNVVIDNIRFSGWPKLEITIDGDRFNGTMPTELMRGFIEFQDDFYRAYTELRYKTNNIQRLTPQDKERLEFVFKIEDNCTKGTAEESDIINAVIENVSKIFSNMTGIEQLAGIAILVFSYTGYKIFEKYSDNKLSENNNESGNNALRIQKEAVVEALYAAGKIPQNATEFKDRTESSFKSIFKYANGAKTISIGNQSWNQDEIEEIIQKPDKNREKKELNLSLYIEGIRRNRGYLTLNVNNGDDHSFSMRVESNMADVDETAKLFDAFKSNKKIGIIFTAKIIDGNINTGNFIKLAD